MTRQFWANLALSVFLGSLAIFAVTKISSALTPKGLFASEPQPSAEAAALMPKVTLAKYQVGEKQDHVIEADFHIKNDSDQDVKNICVLCEFYDSRGNYKDRKWWTLNKTVPAGETITVSSSMRRFINSGARALICRITDFQPVKEPFYVLHKAASGGHGGATAESAHGVPEQSSGGH